MEVPLHGCNVMEQVQYPDAQQTMMTDLSSIRRWAGFLQKTEIKFDMLSAVDELSKQVRHSDQLLLYMTGRRKVQMELKENAVLGSKRQHAAGFL